MNPLVLAPVSLAFGASAAMADPELVAKYGPLLAQCYEENEGDNKRQCIGALAQSCMTEEDGGETTLGMSMCNNSEAEFWDGLLNDEYRQTIAWAQEMDADEAEYFPEFANRAEALRDAQRAWIGYRDAECGLAYALWGSGSMRHIAGTDCIMTMTAERTIELREMRMFFE